MIGHNIRRKGLTALLLIICYLSTGLNNYSQGQILSGQDSASMQGQKVKQPVYVTTRLVTERPVIDGKLDDECWNHGNWAGDYTQFVPHEGAKPTFGTEHNIQYDDKYL